jgi:hypothetical protein
MKDKLDEELAAGDRILYLSASSSHGVYVGRGEVLRLGAPTNPDSTKVLIHIDGTTVGSTVLVDRRSLLKWSK